MSVAKEGRIREADLKEETWTSGWALVLTIFSFSHALGVWTLAHKEDLA